VLSTPSRVGRAFLAVFAVVVLVGACGGDDGDKKADPSERSDTTADSKADDTKPDDAKADDKADDKAKADEALTDDPCSLLDTADLRDVTGVEFDHAEPGDNSCTYTSSDGASAIALHLADLKGAAPTIAIDAGKGSCDAGTVEDLDFSDADGGFGCLVNGVPTVAAVGDGVFAVLTGATLDKSADTDRILQDLATILENAITRR
jgi:hypothetical protein